jgi:hypothetical protein
VWKNFVEIGYVEPMYHILLLLLLLLLLFLLLPLGAWGIRETLRFTSVS